MSEPMNRIANAVSLADVLRSRAEAHGSRTAYTYLVDGETREANLKYDALDRRARVIAATLQERPISGARVVLLYPIGLDYIAGFLGVLYAGAIPVPVCPPIPARFVVMIGNIDRIARDSGAEFVLTTGTFASAAEPYLERTRSLGALEWIATTGLTREASEWRPPPAASADDLAFLQYTSGSTGEPKGVMVSHGNLIANLASAREAFGVSAESCVVSWLPPYHDMGLIGGILQPLYSGCRSVLMSPFAFLQKPARWLRAISKYRATISGGPDFGYGICARKIREGEMTGQDLSSWDLAFSGSETVRPECVDGFSAKFAPWGFERRAFFPCYGLAESTLLVSGGPRDQAPLVRGFCREELNSGRAVAGADGDDGIGMLVGCGVEASGTSITIVDPKTGRRCDGTGIGEIWVRGESVAKGYWQNPEATRVTFSATIDGEGGDTYLRTGDLGFLAEGQLFVCGRLKDIIIVRGVNYYPQDIELTAWASCPQHLHAGGGAAFSVESSTGVEVVVLFEVERRHSPDRRAGKDGRGGGDDERRSGAGRRAEIPEINAFAPPNPRQAAPQMDGIVVALREAVAEHHGVAPRKVLLVKPGSIPKTSSGKVRRHLCKHLYSSGELQASGAVLFEG